MRLNTIEKTLRQRNFGTVIDPGSIQKSLGEIFKESQLEKNNNKFLKFLVYIENTLITMKTNPRDIKFRDQIIGALNLQKLDPELQKPEWSQAREKIRAIV